MTAGLTNIIKTPGHSAVQKCLFIKKILIPTTFLFIILKFKSKPGRMKWIKRILIALVSLLLLVVLIDLGLNFWIARQLPHIINENNDSPYHISYKNLDISLLNRTLKATEIVLVPKTSLKAKAGKPGIYTKVKSVEVNAFNIWDIAFGRQIHARSLVVNKPEVTLIKKKENALNNPKSIGSEVVKPFGKIITVSDVFLNNGQFKITTLKNKSVLNVSNVSIKLEGILITEETLSKKMPFIFRTYSVDCDSVFYRPSGFYHIKLKALKTTNTGLTLSDFEMRPTVSRKAFVRAVPKEKDLYTISAKNVAINNILWGFKNEEFYFNSGNIAIDGADADIYRSKLPDDDLTKKKLYNRLLRDIPFALNIDTLLLKNSRLVYEEEKDFEKGPGILTFNKFNMAVTGITSGFKQTKLDDVNINIQCLFMNSAKLEVDWKFNVLDKTDGFNIRGHIFNFPAERLIPFTKPYVNAEVKGDLDEVYFNFTGNDKNAKGDFAINYDQLKVKIFKKNDRKKKNKILTALANLFIKKDTKDKVNSAEIEIDRIQEKSFYNFLWRSVAEGLKKILL
jgi:hypothetical protein